MSWDATLTDANGYCMGDWNYTHNTSKMIYYVLCDSEYIGAGKSWWQILSGMSGAEGGRYLNTIVRGLEADPERYRAMNPANGWGNYDGLLRVLREMRQECVSERPTEWVCSG